MNIIPRSLLAIFILVEMCSHKVKFLSIITPRSFSLSIVLISRSLYFSFPIKGFHGMTLPKVNLNCIDSILCDRQQ